MNYYNWLLQFLHFFCKARLHFLLSIASFIISFFQVSNAQATASLKIKFSPTWDLNKVQVFFNNGKDKRPLKPISATHQFVVKDSFYATYATITVSYSINENISLTNNFFLSDKPASIFFTSDPKKANNPLDTYIAKNIVEVYKTPAGKRFMLELKKDYEDYKQLMLKLNIDNKYNTDSLEYILNVRDSIIQKKELEFIRNNGNYYFSLWLFRQRFDYTYIQGSPDTLLSIFSSSFSPKLKNSPEGIQMNDILEGWTAIKHKKLAPLFASTDINNKSVSLEDYRGKYVLLHFWATWCIPCLDEIPLLRKIRDEYQEAELSIISVSYDTDSAILKKWINKMEMNWTNIYQDKTLINLYGNTPIPALYLINGTGQIIFSGFESPINELTKLLEKLLR